MYDSRHSTLAPPRRRVPLHTASGAASITVSIYDDHVLARRGLAALLRSEPIAVLRETSVDGELADGGAEHPPCDVTLIAAAGGRGLELARVLSRRHGAKVLLILDGPDDAAASLALFATGAAGAVCRRCPGERVLEAVTELAAGRAVPACPHHRAPAQPQSPSLRLLSERERRVAAELARGSQTEEIAAALCISPHTVRTHVRNIKRKLGARTTVQAVAMALAGDELASPPATADR